MTDSVNFFQYKNLTAQVEIFYELFPIISINVQKNNFTFPDGNTQVCPISYILICVKLFI
jgi:hypothetical protein